MFSSCFITVLANDSFDLHIHGKGMVVMIIIMKRIMIKIMVRMMSLTFSCLKES